MPFVHDSATVCQELHAQLTPPVVAGDVFLITLKYDGGCLYSSVSHTVAPPAAETYITLIGSNDSNLCHHVGFMDQQRRLLKINTGIAHWDRGTRVSISSPMNLAFQVSSFHYPPIFSKVITHYWKDTGNRKCLYMSGSTRFCALCENVRVSWWGNMHVTMRNLDI